MSRELRALLLDFDGTVAETERYGHRVAYNQAFAEMKLDWRWDEELYGNLLSVAGGKERLRHYCVSLAARAAMIGWTTMIFHQATL